MTFEENLTPFTNLKNIWYKLISEFVDPAQYTDGVCGGQEG